MINKSIEAIGKSHLSYQCLGYTIYGRYALTRSVPFLSTKQSLLQVNRYCLRWPQSPAEELFASSGTVYNSELQKMQGLRHKRRVDCNMARRRSAAFVCSDCYRAFVSKPRLCKFALANDLWLGPVDPPLVEGELDTQDVSFIGSCRTVVEQLCAALDTLARVVMIPHGDHPQDRGGKIMWKKPNTLEY